MQGLAPTMHLQLLSKRVELVRKVGARFSTFNAPSTTQQKSGIGHDCEVLVHDHFLSDVEHMLKVPHAVIYGSGRPFKRAM